MNARYSVLIRTKNSAKTLRLVIESVNQQTLMPCQIVAVDSGSTDETLTILSQMGISRLDYPSTVPFNYSRSLNMGFESITEPWILCLSSHTALHSRDAVEKLFDGAARRPDAIAAYAVVYPSNATKPVGPSRIREIGFQQFDGYNGLWNTCALVRRNAWKEHPFPIDVWTAEDQAWAAWHFRNKQNCVTLRVEGLDVEYLNPYQSEWKGASEFVSIATHAYPGIVCWKQMLRGLLGAIWRSVKFRKLAGHTGLQLLACLLLYKLKLLGFKSDYHDGPPSLVRWLFNS